jgi:hypothetical protein
MKAIVKIGLWKATAFLTAAILFLFSFSFSFVGCRPESDPAVPDTLVKPVLKPLVTNPVAENITTTTATLAAMVTPNADNT